MQINGNSWPISVRNEHKTRGKCVVSFQSQRTDGKCLNKNISYKRYLFCCLTPTTGTCNNFRLLHSHCGLSIFNSYATALSLVVCWLRGVPFRPFGTCWMKYMENIMSVLLCSVSKFQWLRWRATEQDWREKARLILASTQTNIK